MSGGLGVLIPAATDLSRKKGSDSSTAKRSATGASITGHIMYMDISIINKLYPLKTNVPFHSMCDTLNKPSLTYLPCKPSIGQNLHYFTGNGDVSMSVKNS